MAFGRTNAGGGGSFNKSVIIVTAPTGSTVTCFKGEVTKTASEKNGTWTFSGLEEGTWTVKATLSGQTVTQTVNITQFGVYRVEMSYFKAYIQVTYPVGSTCTCSKEEEVLTAPDTSGSHTFTVTSAGTWTITITDGLSQKTKTVNIASSGQTVSVILVYGEYLYYEGDQAETITGGWANNTSGAVDAIFNENDIELIITSSTLSNCAAQTQNEVNLSGYTTLTIIGNVVSFSNTGAVFRLGVMPQKNKSPVSGGNWSAILMPYINSTGPFEHTVDITSVTSGYVTVSTGGGIPSDVKITKVILS